MHMPARIAAAAALCILLAAGAAPAQEPVKLAFVDMQKALNESKSGKKALGELQKLMEERKSGLQKQKEALEKKKDELDKQGLLLNEDTRKSRESEDPDPRARLQPHAERPQGGVRAPRVRVHRRHPQGPAQGRSRRSARRAATPSFSRNSTAPSCTLRPPST